MVAVPAMLILVRLLLPSDRLTGGPNGPPIMVAGAPVLHPGGTLPGVADGDLLEAINGYPVRDLLRARAEGSLKRPCVAIRVA